MIDWGPYQELREQQAELDGREYESDEPDLYEDLQCIWYAFLDLNRKRVAIYDYAPIPASEIEAWLNIHGVTDPGLREDYYALISSMDVAWREIMKDKKGTKNANPVPGSRQQKGGHGRP